MKKEDLPKKIAVFPLSNFIIFPKTTVPLNIFEPRYIDMINDSMRSNKFIGMIQPKSLKDEDNFNPKLYRIGCLGKIISFKETDDGRYLIELKGLIRFETREEVTSEKKYREFTVNFENFFGDLNEGKENIKGVMIESHLNEGNQKIGDSLNYGQSITDACMGWEDTISCLNMLNQAVLTRRGSK